MLSAKTDLIEWLLASQTPSIRYKTMLLLQSKVLSDPEVRASRKAVMENPPVTTILAGQTPVGNWSHENSYYTPKYTSSHWSMLLLTEFEADGSDPRLRSGAEHMLDSTSQGLPESWDVGKSGLSCFWGNVLRYSLHCGFKGDPRVDAITRYLERDALEHTWQCRYNGGLPCAWGVGRALWGLAALRPTKRTAETTQALQRGISFLVDEHDLVSGSFPTDSRVHRLWTRLNFPLFYQTDILFILRVLAELDALHTAGSRKAIEWLNNKRNKNGQWRGASPYRRRTWDGLADREDTDRWITLHASIILDQAFA
jgi:hypothetical protein